MKSCDLVALLGDCLSLLRRSEQVGPDHVIELQAPESLTTLGDENLLRQVFWNLSLNAVQAMPGGGTLEIRTSSGNGHVQILFSDSGCGIPELLMPLVQEPWVTTKPQAAGIGLSLVRRVVRAHGGSIAIENRPAGGVRLKVHLPAGRFVDHGGGENPNH